MHGDKVNIAARIQPLAEPEGICISEDIARQILSHPEIRLIKLGRPELKNIQVPMEVYRVVMPWEKVRSVISEQAKFKLKQKKVQQRVLVVKTLFIAAVLIFAGLYLWNKVEEKRENVKVGAGLKPVPTMVQEAVSLPKNRIAILPFVNLSADAGNEYFSDGITEEMISRLSRISHLTVIARTSAMAYKGTNKKVEEIGRELRVGTVLEGSVRKVGDQLRITVQLIDVESQGHLWTQDYDRELKDVFGIQSDVAQNVVEALKAQLLAGEKEQIEKKGTESLEAYNLYLKGLYHANKYSEEGFKKGIKYFEEVIEKDPSYAQAYAMIAFSYDNLGFYGFLPQKVAYSKVKLAATKALELDNTNAEAYGELGNTKLFNDYDWSGAESAYKRAIELNPNSALAHYWYGINYLSPLERHEEAIAEIKRALELDPLSLLINGDLGWAFYHARRYDEAIEQSRKVLEMDPNLFTALWCLGETYVAKKMYGEAIAAIQKMVDITGGWSGAVASLGWAYAEAGQRDQAQKLLGDLKERAKQEEIPSIYFAVLYSGLDEKDQAFEHLQKVYEEGSGFLPYLKVNRFWDNLRSDPRFTELLKKVGLPTE